MANRDIALDPVAQNRILQFLASVLPAGSLASGLFGGEPLARQPGESLEEFLVRSVQAGGVPGVAAGALGGGAMPAPRPPVGGGLGLSPALGKVAEAIPSKTQQLTGKLGLASRFIPEEIRNLPPLQKALGITAVGGIGKSLLDKLPQEEAPAPPEEADLAAIMQELAALRGGGEEAPAESPPMETSRTEKRDAQGNVTSVTTKETPPKPQAPAGAPAIPQAGEPGFVGPEQGPPEIQQLMNAIETAQQPGEAPQGPSTIQSLLSIIAPALGAFLTARIAGLGGQEALTAGARAGTIAPQQIQSRFEREEEQFRKDEDEREAQLQRLNELLLSAQIGAREFKAKTAKDKKAEARAERSLELQEEQAQTPEERLADRLKVIEAQGKEARLTQAAAPTKGDKGASTDRQILANQFDITQADNEISGIQSELSGLLLQKKKDPKLQAQLQSQLANAIDRKTELTIQRDDLLGRTKVTELPAVMANFVDADASGDTAARALWSKRLLGIARKNQKKVEKAIANSGLSEDDQVSLVLTIREAIGRAKK